MTSWVCFEDSRLKLIFHWKAHSLTLFKSQFKSQEDAAVSQTTGNSEVSLANSFRFVDRLSGKSLIYIRNSNGPRIEPSETPASTHLLMRRFVRSIQPFAFDLLRSQLKFPASYPEYRSVSTCKEDPGAKPCQMLQRYLRTQLLHQGKHQKICRSCEW